MTSAWTRTQTRNRRTSIVLSIPVDFWSMSVSAKAGEVARENGVYRCEGCHQRMAVQTGALIGQCQYCGSASFETGWRTLANQPTAEAFFHGLGSGVALSDHVKS